MRGFPLKRILALAFVVSSSAVLAQEIGTEIPADQQQTPPPSDQTPNYDNPYATPTTPPPLPVKKDDQAATDSNSVPGPRKGAFGLRAGFGGGGIPTVSGATGAPTVGAPTIGLRYLVTESVALNIDVGLLIAFSNTMALGFGAGFGIDAFLGNKSLPVRPFVTGGAGFARGAAPLDRDGGLALAFSVGGGGEYWFNNHFSVNARALLGIPVSVTSQLTVVTIATFMPGLGATVYF